MRDLVLGESWNLAKSCFQVLKKDKELIVYPLILTAIVFAIIIAFVVNIFYNIWLFVLLLLSIPILIVALFSRGLL